MMRWTNKIALSVVLRNSFQPIAFLYRRPGQYLNKLATVLFPVVAHGSKGLSQRHQFGQQRIVCSTHFGFSYPFFLRFHPFFLSFLVFFFFLFFSILSFFLLVSFSCLFFIFFSSLIFYFPEMCFYPLCLIDFFLVAVSLEELLVVSCVACDHFPLPQTCVMNKEKNILENP